MGRFSLILVLALSSACAAQLGPALPDTKTTTADASHAEQSPSEVRRLVPRGPEARGAGDAGTPKSDPRASSILGTLIPLIAVVSLILAAAWVVRRLARGSGSLAACMGAGGRSPAGVLEVLGRYPIGRGASLVLLRLDKRVLLLSQFAGVRGSSGMATLADINDPEEVASLLLRTREQEGESLSARFQSILARGAAKEAPDVIDVTGDGPRARDAQTQASRLVGVRG